MEPDLFPSTDLPPDGDDLFVLGQDKPPYPIRRRRAVTVVVTAAWMVLMSALCAYILIKW